MGSAGRVLVAHLAVEHFLTRHLEKENPNLGSLDDARLTFAQKLELLNKSRLAVAIKPGLKTLNKVRNRLVHSLNSQVTKDDCDELLSVAIFKAFREEAAKKSQRQLSDDPLTVLEEFSRFAGSLLQPVPFAHLWAEAFEAVNDS